MPPRRDINFTVAVSVTTWVTVSHCISTLVCVCVLGNLRGDSRWPEKLLRTCEMERMSFMHASDPFVILRSGKSCVVLSKAGFGSNVIAFIAKKMHLKKGVCVCV